MYYAGIDIGGTKCAVVLGAESNGEFTVLAKERFPTVPDDPLGTLDTFRDVLAGLLSQQELLPSSLSGIGISCGGPLSSKRGVILSPPNLPAWDNIEIVRFFETAFGVPTALQNDANACALAEWKFGAGKGADNMAFLTFGTGLGAGLILNSRLYCGPDDMAGELGHLRLTDDGPTGYGKAGSVEGYCSGGGIRQLGQQMAERELAAGRQPRLLEQAGSIEGINAKNIADLADEGDPLCLEVYHESGRRLGQALSILVDLLNPEVIVIGSIFVRSHNLLWEVCDEVMRRECLSISYGRCRVVGSALGERVGDIAALTVAMGGY